MSNTNQENIWLQYEKHIELYQFYMNLVIKLNTLHFAISGAIISFYFANRSEEGIVLALALPGLMSLSLSVLFVYGALANLSTRIDMFKIRDTLGLDVAPEFIVLTVLLLIFAVANIVTFGGIVYEICNRFSA